MKTCHNNSIPFDLSANHEMLCDIAQDEFLFLPPIGNTGDGVIACATYQAFSRMGCRYRVIDTEAPPSVTRDRFVVVGGGGTLVPLYDRTSEFILKHHHAAQRITVMPSTIRGNEDLIAKARNVTFYRRDRKSLEYVRSVSATTEAKFAHDMALMLDLDELADNSGGWRSNGFSPRRWNRLVVRPLLASMLFRYRNRLSPNSLSAFRIDSEKTGQAIPKMNLDVSSVLGRSRNFTKVESRMVTRNMVGFLSRFTDVSTNRLHVAITAALLGLRVNLFDNSYGKNLAIYESSLNQRFKAMKYCEFGPQNTIRKAA